MKEIETNYNDYVAIVDDEDFELINQFQWFALVVNRPGLSIPKIYAYRKIYFSKKILPIRKSIIIYMHRFLMGVTDHDIQVDHRNSNGLDNTRSNLRLSTHGQNQHNRQKGHKLTSSQYKGVVWNKKNSRWHACIGGKYVGVFRNELAAAQAYDRAAIRLYGDYALLNTSRRQKVA